MKEKKVKPKKVSLFDTWKNSETRKLRKQKQLRERNLTTPSLIKAQVQQDLITKLEEHLKRSQDRVVFEVTRKDQLSAVLEVLNDLSDSYEYTQGNFNDVKEIKNRELMEENQEFIITVWLREIEF